MILERGRVIATQNGQKKQVSQCDSGLKTLCYFTGKTSDALKLLLPAVDIAEVEAVGVTILFMFK